MLVQRLRRWPDIKTTLDERLVFAEVTAADDYGVIHMAAGRPACRQLLCRRRVWHYLRARQP